MDRSSQQGKRAERLTRTPYARPTPTKQKSTPGSAFGAIKSALNIFRSPFSRGSPTLPIQNGHNDLPVDQRSESGSEDNWEGDGPTSMEGQDMFSVAAAAGRSGEAFESRQAEWRSRGEIPGGKRETGRRELQLAPFKGSNKSKNLGIVNGKVITPSTPVFPGHFFKDSQAGPSPSLNTIKETPVPVAPPKNRQPTSAAPVRTSAETPNAVAGPSNIDAKPSTPLALPERLPIPSSFTTPSRLAFGSAPGIQCAQALSSFLEEKQGKVLTSEDRIIIEALTARIRETDNGGSPGSERRGGWLPSSTSGEVSFRGKLLHSPSSTFLSSRTPFKQRYLGPGMSPKKTLSNSPASDRLRSSTSAPVLAPIHGPDPSSLPPSFPNRHLVNTLLSYSATSSPLRKSHRPAVSSAPDAVEPISPQATVIGTKRKPESPTNTRSPKRRDIEATGRQNAAAIMQSILDETDSALPQTHIEPVRFNSYDRSSLHANAVSLAASSSSQAAGPSTPGKHAPPVPRTAPSTDHAGSTPRRRTPLRGAAAKLEAHRQAMVGKKPLTTVERIQGVKPWEASQNAPKQKSTLSQSQTSRQPQPEETAESESESDSDDDFKIVDAPVKPLAKAFKKPAATAPTPQPPKIMESANSEPFRVPPFSFSGSGVTRRSTSPTKPAESYGSTVRKRVIEASEKAEAEERAKAEARAKVEAEKRAKIEAEERAKAEELEKIEREKAEERAKIERAQAEERAKAEELAKAEERAEAEKRVEAEERARAEESAKVQQSELTTKDAALNVDKAALPIFTFVLTSTLAPVTTKLKTEKAKEEAARSFPPTFAFTLESALPAEEPRPTVAPSAPVVSTPAAAPALTPFTGWGSGVQKSKAAGGAWTCSSCMLQNPDRAKEQCTICEAPRGSQ